MNTAKKYKKKLDENYSFINAENNIPNINTVNQNQMTVNRQQNAMPSPTANTVKKTNLKDEALSKYRSQIQLDTIDQKAETAVAYRKANDYLQNYLKSQGIANTGLGASNYVNLASNYANTLANIEANKRADQQKYEQDYENSRIDVLSDLLGSMNTGDREAKLNQIINTEGLSDNSISYLRDYITALNNNDVKDFVASDNFALMNGDQYLQYIDSLSKQPGTNDSMINYVKNAAKVLGIDAESTAKSAISTLKETLGTVKTSEEYKVINDYISTLQNAINTGNENEIAKAYKSVLNDISVTSTDNQVSDISGRNVYSADEIKPEYFGDFNGSDRANSNQSIAVNNLIQASKTWKGNSKYDGIIVNVNWGAGTPSYWKYNSTTNTWENLGKETTDKNNTVDIKHLKNLDTFYNVWDEHLNKLKQ